MSWNHRVIRHVTDEGDEWFGIHEVYYDDGEPHSCTKEHISPCQEDIPALKWELEKMLQAIDKPVIDYQHFLDIEVANEADEERGKE